MTVDPSPSVLFMKMGNVVMEHRLLSRFVLRKIHEPLNYKFNEGLIRYNLYIHIIRIIETLKVGHRQ